MQKLSSKKAFSLIELSIVILIIGILIAGVTQSSRLIKAMKLSTARSVTRSSPVSSIKDMVAWYDSVSETSFDSAVSDDTASNKIATWYDINTQSSIKNNATQATDANKPTYVIDAVSGLPMVNFNGTTQYFDMPDGTIPAGDSSYTIFIATKPGTNATFDKTFLCAEAVTNVDYNIFRYRTSSTYYNLVSSGPNTNSAIIDADKLNIVVTSYSNGISYTSSSLKKITTYKNGAAPSTDTITTPLITPLTNNALGVRKNNGGTGDFMYGNIGEVIIFSRALKIEEIDAVEKYLGQKWGVKIS